MVRGVSDGAAAEAGSHQSLADARSFSNVRQTTRTQTTRANSMGSTCMRDKLRNSGSSGGGVRQCSTLVTSPSCVAAIIPVS